SPFVDILKTKRWWILAMQLLLGAGMAGIAFFIPVPFFFQATLAVFWLVAFSSATQDIAADGFYMLALDTHQQSLYVGIRSTFYRIALIMGQGVLIILAGWMESTSGLEPVALNVQGGPGLTSTTLSETNAPPSTHFTEATFIVSSNELVINSQSIPKDSAGKIKSEAHSQNIANGFVLPQGNNGKTKDQSVSWWSATIAKPLGSWIKSNFGEKKAVQQVTANAGNLARVAIHLNKAPGAGEKRILVFRFESGDKSISISGDDRFVFTAENWDKPAILTIQTDPKLDKITNASFRGTSGNIPLAWSVTFFILGGLFIFFYLYHRFILPYPTSDKPAATATASNIFNEFLMAFRTFFQKKQVGIAILFLLTYRFAEAQLLKLVTPFLLDNKEIGGLGLTTGEVGLVYGTVGILSLTIGGIIGGITAARGGLKKWLWPMALSMILTAVTFLYLSIFTPDNFFIINLCVAIEQFGYGFGFTAYMMYMIFFAQGEYKTSHYAICTAFMALGMMLPGMFAGWLQEQLGYQ
ncbi:MAG TPA: MFS transporter, partial [Prolixibacteraceae bacterium]|nr:MFS transporter [Prolixibacteraceae bacterium]